MRQLSFAIFRKTSARNLPGLALRISRDNAHSDTRSGGVGGGIAFVFLRRLRILDRGGAELVGGGQSGLGGSRDEDSRQQLLPQRGREFQFVHLVIIAFVAYGRCFRKKSHEYGCVL